MYLMFRSYRMLATVQPSFESPNFTLFIITCDVLIGKSGDVENVCKKETAFEWFSIFIPKNMHYNNKEIYDQ